MDAKPDEKKKTGAMEPRTQHAEEKRRPGTTTEETSTEKVTVLYLHQQSACRKTSFYVHMRTPSCSAHTNAFTS